MLLHIQQWGMTLCGFNETTNAYCIPMKQQCQVTTHATGRSILKLLPSDHATGRSLKKTLIVACRPVHIKLLK